jgi:hypothetical protein
MPGHLPIGLNRSRNVLYRNAWHRRKLGILRAWFYARGLTPHASAVLPGQASRTTARPPAGLGSRTGRGRLRSQLPHEGHELALLLLGELDASHEIEELDGVLQRQ